MISKASKGCLDAFNLLVLLYQSLAYQHAYSLIGDAATAEDVTQESFIKAFKGIHRFRRDTLRPWLLKIVTNTAYDLLRQHKRHSTRSFYLIDENGQEFYPYDLLADPSPSVETAVEQNEFEERLYRMLDELPELYRSVLTLVDIYALGYAEVSEILEVPNRSTCILKLSLETTAGMRTTHFSKAVLFLTKIMNLEVITKIRRKNLHNSNCPQDRLWKFSGPRISGTLSPLLQIGK